MNYINEFRLVGKIESIGEIFTYPNGTQVVVCLIQTKLNNEIMTHSVNFYDELAHELIHTAIVGQNINVDGSLMAIEYQKNNRTEKYFGLKTTSFYLIAMVQINKHRNVDVIPPLETVSHQQRSQGQQQRSQGQNSQQGRQQHPQGQNPQQGRQQHPQGQNPQQGQQQRSQGQNSQQGRQQHPQGQNPQQGQQQRSQGQNPQQGQQQRSQGQNPQQGQQQRSQGQNPQQGQQQHPQGQNPQQGQQQKNLDDHNWSQNINWDHQDSNQQTAHQTDEITLVGQEPIQQKVKQTKMQICGVDVDPDLPFAPK